MKKFKKNKKEQATTDFYDNKILHSLMTRPKDFELTHILDLKENSESIIDKFLSSTQLDRYNEDFMDKYIDKIHLEQISQLELDYIANKHIIEQIMVDISVALDLLVCKKESYINERQAMQIELDEINAVLGDEKYA